MSDHDPLKGDDRLFVRKGRRHYRPAYSTTEFRIGAVVLLGLAVVASWIAWKGAHPDPELFSSGADLLEMPSATTAIPAESDGRRMMSDGPSSTTEEAGIQEPEPSAAAGADRVPAGDRGPLPAGLAASGWSEGAVSRFDPSNLYVKINGREDYYKSFGFRELCFISLTSNEDPETTVDIEMYDLGESANALGAYAGERSAGVTPEVGPNGMSHLDRNALYMTRGRYYLRAIGSSESDAVQGQLKHLRKIVDAGLPGEPLPWAYSLFVGIMGLPFGSVAYAAENAFSFEFADGIYSATLDDETELFVFKAGSPDGASSLARQFRDGFREYGSPASAAAGENWTKDRYIGTIAGAAADNVWLMGVRGAPDVTAAEKAMDRLRKAVASLEGSPNGES
jgi:hypothetical protein